MTTQRLLSLLHGAVPCSKEEQTSLLASLDIHTNAVTKKTIGGVTYVSDQANGISLQYECDVRDKDKVTCQAIDVYNEDGAKGWKAYSGLPLTLFVCRSDRSSVSLDVTHTTTGKDFVSALGEPSRKGGGEPLKGGGASGLGPGAWMEWKGLVVEDRSIALMIELGGPDVRGPGRWEKGKGGAARWAVCTFSIEEG